MIPCIAEVLNILEQELFSSELEYSNDYNVRYSKDAREILDLLQFAPKNAIEDIKNYLIKYKNTYESGIKKAGFFPSHRKYFNTLNYLKVYLIHK